MLIKAGEFHPQKPTMKSVLVLECVLHHLCFSLLLFQKFLLESNVPDLSSVQFNGLRHTCLALKSLLLLQRSSDTLHIFMQSGGTFVNIQQFLHFKSFAKHSLLHRAALPFTGDLSGHEGVWRMIELFFDLTQAKLVMMSLIHIQSSLKTSPKSCKISGKTTTNLKRQQLIFCKDMWKWSFMCC